MQERNFRLLVNNPKCQSKHFPIIFTPCDHKIVSSLIRKICILIVKDMQCQHRVHKLSASTCFNRACSRRSERNRKRRDSSRRAKAREGGLGPVALSVLHDPTQTSLVFSLLRFYRAVCCRALYFQLNALNRLATISLVLRPFTAKPLLRFSYNYTVKSGYEIKLLLKDLKPRD